MGYMTRAEWARNRRTFYSDDYPTALSTNISSYASSDEIAKAVKALQSVYTKLGRTMRQSRCPEVRQPREKQSDYLERWRALSEKEQDKADPYQKAQYTRRRIVEALKAIAAGDVTNVEFDRLGKLYALDPCHQELEPVARIRSRYRGAHAAAITWEWACVLVCPIDDAAWERELERRRRVEAYDANPSNLFTT